MKLIPNFNALLALVPNFASFASYCIYTPIATKNTMKQKVERDDDRLSCIIPLSLKRKLKSRAALLGIPSGQLVKICIEFYLQNASPEMEMEMEEDEVEPVGASSRSSWRNLLKN